MTGSQASPSFRLGYVAGVTPGKWARIWQERSPAVPLELVLVPAAEATDRVRDGAVDAVLQRSPIDREGLHAIPLYTETTVVVVPKDHVVTAADEVTSADLAEDVLFHPLDDTLDWVQMPGLPAVERPATTAAAIQLVAAGVGLLVVPQSLARLHHRKDLTYRPVVDAPTSSVALSWLASETTDLMEQFIGIVRGRTVNSTRGRQPVADQPAPARRARQSAPRSTTARDRQGSGKRGKRGRPRRR
ncbi:LysR substrate binding domain-containing protein [Tamaricihabitans halophyticus]|uniref:LysR substrate binding domain-containing protein n=1 Tax=Tamaricihabitans halophyticus TaxID=1262583 RepID=A0A4R2QXT7_9PSEU|nr:LysR substrate-binding domain-containing protein [Tamaricihabitans halophyticus]TCP55012.1 LysR substrate binding domain-containing protein [Tamaricihabitans halophyticus]